MEDGLFPAGYSMRQFKHRPAAGSEDAVIKASALRCRPVKVTGGIERHTGAIQGSRAVHAANKSMENGLFPAVGCMLQPKNRAAAMPATELEIATVFGQPIEVAGWVDSETGRRIRTVLIAGESVKDLVIP